MQCKPLFATPTATGKVAYEFAGSCTRMAGLLSRNGIQFWQTFLPGVPFVDAARNFLLSQFLTDFPEATDLFFIDDDVGFPEGKVLELLERPEDVVCGVYPLKNEGPIQFPVMLKLKDGRTIKSNGLFQALNVPAGFMRLKRSVVELLASKADTYKFEEKGGEPRVVFNVFEMGPVRGEYVGEDVMFSRKCHDLGVDLWVDTDIDFHHRGDKRWEGNFGTTLKSWLEKNEVNS